MSLETARAVADAVLYEGYVLYPYYASADKNRVRWQWGVIGPQGAEDDGAAEGPALQAECLVRGGAETTVQVHLRFLHVRQRQVERALDDGGFAPAEELAVGDRAVVGWDEAVSEHLVLHPGPLGATGALGEQGWTDEIRLPGDEEVELVSGPEGATAGRIVRRRWPLTGVVRVSAEPVSEGEDPTSPTAVGGGLHRLRVRLENTAVWTGGGTRDDALRRSFVAAHLVLVAEQGSFVSLMDPPPAAAAAAAACEQLRVYPVLVGDPERADTVLVSPIILYDYPEIAPESPGELCDGTEIDELLTLRVLTLTEEEKAKARATDPLAAEIIDRAEGLTPAAFDRLHGAIRSLRALAPDAAEGGGPEVGTAFGASGDDELTPWWDPGADAAVSPTEDRVDIDGVQVGRGSKVRLQPSRRADAHDTFLVGRIATVARVYFDVDGGTHLAVTVDDDPGSDLFDDYGRYLYFGPEEVIPLEPAAGGSGP